MSAPLLRSVAAVPAHRRHMLPALPEHVSAYVVVDEGHYLGTAFAAGDVLVCRGEARSGRATVLEARHGRPRVGALLGARLVGDAGEPCHPSRWRAVGQLVAVYRRTTAGWVVELLDGDAADVALTPAPAPRPAAAREAEVRVGQLSLFAA